MNYTYTPYIPSWNSPQLSPAEIEGIAQPSWKLFPVSWQLPDALAHNASLALLIQFTRLVPLKARAAACARARLECGGERQRENLRAVLKTGFPRFAFVLQEAEVPCRAARRRVTWVAWVAGAAVTPQAARAPEARCRLSTTRARRHPPGRARWSTIRIRTRHPTPIITRTRPGIIHRHRRRRRITQATCRSTPGIRRTPIPDYSRKSPLFRFANRSISMEVWCIAFKNWRNYCEKLSHLVVFS